MRPWRPRLFPILAALILLASPSAAQTAGSGQLRQIAILELPGRPGFGATAFAAGHLVIAHPGAGAVDIFDPGRRRLVKQIAGLQNPQGLAVDEAAGRVYVADAGSNRIVVLSTADWTAQPEIKLEFAPQALLPLTEHKLLIVSHGREPALTRLDLSTLQAHSLKLEGRISRLEWDPQRKVVFATLPAQQEVIAVTPELVVAARYRLTASQPTGLALDAETRRLYVAVRHAIVELDADTGQERLRIPAPPGADELWIDAASRTLFAASSNGTVQMVSIGGERPQSQHEMRTPVRGRSIAFDAGRDLLYLPGGHEGRSKLLILQRMPAAPGDPPPTRATRE